MAWPRRASRLVILTGIVVFVFLLFRWMPVRTGFTPIKSSRPRFKKSTVDWSTYKTFHPPNSIKPLPAATKKELPRVQAPASAFKHTEETEQRREAVRAAFKRSYYAYRKYAWLRDEVTPVSHGAKDTFGGWAATLVDSLDTLWIMGFKEEFWEAASVATALDWGTTKSGAINMFETTIRYLGGLLSAYDLSGDAALLDKAKELGDLLYIGFDTPNRLPGFWLNFREAKEGLLVAGTADPSASPASLCVEFTRLSQLTGDSKFYDATDRITRFLESVQNDTHLPGMWPTVLNFQHQEATSSSFTLGALADSLYEYLPKMYALLGGVDKSYEQMYRTSMDTVIKHMLFRPMLPDGKDILFTGEYHANAAKNLIPESQHLTCFVGGMFGLGGRLFNIDEHVEIGEKLARGCGWAYSSFPTGVMPEIFNLIPCEKRDICAWDEQYWQKHGSDSLAKGFTNARDSRYLLRPEAIESIFILYRITGKSELQDIAWTMFQSIMKATSTDIANSAIADVREKGKTKKLDSMESFWTAETLKYFYLIFSPPDVISLDEYVFNTEAHPLRRPTFKKSTTT